MKEKLSNELDPILLTENDIWGKIVDALIDNPGMCQPVVINHPNTEIEAARFDATLLEIDEGRYLQIEFESELLEKAFLIAFNEIEYIQEGIYRLKIKDKI